MAGKTIPNLGQLSPQMVLESGDLGSINYQAAKVRKPLAAVSDINKKKNPCWFDGEKSYILLSKCPELEEIRRLIQKAQGKIRLHLEKGVFQ